MNGRIIYFWIAIILISCSNSPKMEHEKSQTDLTQRKILIGEKEIRDEIAGSAYRKRATGYFVINEVDTSFFMPIFAESNRDSSISLSLNLPYDKHDLSYSDRLSELDLIFKEASKDFDFDSFKYIGIGRLILLGDMAITLTDSFNNLYDKDGIGTEDYQLICDFLETSQLAKDFNRLFDNYNMEVGSISIEKAFFTSKKELITYAKFDSDTSKIPEMILDCACWIGLKNKATYPQ